MSYVQDNASFKAPSWIWFVVHKVLDCLAHTQKKWIIASQSRWMISFSLCLSFIIKPLCTNVFWVHVFVHLSTVSWTQWQALQTAAGCWLDHGGTATLELQGILVDQAARRALVFPSVPGAQWSPVFLSDPGFLEARLVRRCHLNRGGLCLLSGPSHHAVLEYQ